MGGALTLILALLDQIERLLPAGERALNGLNEVKAKVGQLKAENREPTDAEWDELNATTASLTNRLEAANARLNPSPDPTERAPRDDDNG